jgi:hypothetical protein
MEKFRGEQYITETGDFLNGIDHEANENGRRGGFETN